MRKAAFRAAIVAGIILLPFVAHRLYLLVTGLPKHVVIATGPPDGRYLVLANALARHVRRATNGRVAVSLVHTRGSLDNLRLLRSGSVDFALYQPGTETTLQPPSHAGAVESKQPAFVANLYSQPVHLFFRRGSAIRLDDIPSSLSGKTIAIGLREGGDYAASQEVLRHFGIASNDRNVTTRANLPYDDVVRGFVDGKIDAAFITVGINAPVYRKLASTGQAVLVGVPYPEAFARNNLYARTYTIPAGSYRFEPSEPKSDVSTVAFGAQLLTRADVRSSITEVVARIVNGAEFIKENHLWELARHGTAFALATPEFPLHAGAKAYYDPKLKPLLNADFVEALEGTRSFIASFFIALFLLWRWYRKKRNRQSEHVLDRYIHAVLEIERRQLGIEDDVVALGSMLDEVTRLRHEALSQFTAHQFNEDRGPECFVEMCHALSNKINAKLARATMTTCLSGTPCEARLRRFRKVLRKHCPSP